MWIKFNLFIRGVSKRGPLLKEHTIFNKMKEKFVYQKISCFHSHVYVNT